jgi:transcriptional regulator with XRE-family HTH domain
MLTLGDKIRLAREVRGLSQQELADKAGLCRETVYHIELGQNKDPRFSTVDAIRKALGMDPFLDRFDVFLRVEVYHSSGASIVQVDEVVINPDAVEPKRDS